MCFSNTVIFNVHNNVSKFDRVTNRICFGHVLTVKIKYVLNTFKIY